MDPLSISASVAGLLAVAYKISSILTTAASLVSGAPEVMRPVLSEVSDINVSLSMMQKLLVRIASVPRQRMALIQLDQLIATLTDAVLTFSELEALVAPFAESVEISMVEGVKLFWKEDTISRIMERLQRHKSSLSLMLNIMQCESDLEAERSRATLQSQVSELLASNHDISRRLRNLEDMSESQSILTRCFRNGHNTEATTIITDRSVLGEHSQGRASLQEYHFRFAFEGDLETSRVYKRTQLYDPDASFTSSAIRTHAWSIFSGLSLAEVSIISTIALPLYQHEISNSQWYKFGETPPTEKEECVPDKSLIDQQYEKILRQTPQSRIADLWRIIRWLIYGRRPMTLRELNVVLCWETNRPRWHDLEGDVKFLCGPLVGINNGEVRLAHQTVIDFLQDFSARANEEDLGGIHMDKQRAESHVSLACLKIMLRDTMFGRLTHTLKYCNTSSKFVSDMKKYLEENPFLSYAVTYWASHLQDVQAPDEDLFASALELLADPGRRRDIMHFEYIHRHHSSIAPGGGSELHIAAYYNLPWLVDEFLGRGMDPNSASSLVSGSPLVWATEMGSSASVEKLLRAGADPNQAEIDGWTPLHWAATNGHEHAALLLINNGARADVLDLMERSPIGMAVEQGHMGIVALLQQHNCSVKGVNAIPFQSRSGSLHQGSRYFAGKHFAKRLHADLVAKESEQFVQHS